MQHSCIITYLSSSGNPTCCGTCSAAVCWGQAAGRLSHAAAPCMRIVPCNRTAVLSCTAMQACQAEPNRQCWHCLHCTCCVIALSTGVITKPTGLKRPRDIYQTMPRHASCMASMEKGHLHTSPQNFTNACARRCQWHGAGSVTCHGPMLL